MVKEDLIRLVGYNVCVYLKGHDEPIHGVLCYADNFSFVHDFRKPNYFYIDNINFKVSHVRKILVVDSFFITKLEAIKMLEAQLECLTRDVSGIDEECNRQNCDSCSLNYEKGNLGQQKNCLKLAISSLKGELKND